LELKFEFQYIKCTALLCKRKGITYQIKGVTRENVEHHHDCFECEDPCCDYCVCYLEVDPDVPSQSGVLIMAAEREYITEEFSIPFEYDTTDEPEIITRMKIGGFVFQDQEEQDKDGGHDGKRTQSDLNLENIEVRLYYAETDELVELGKLIEEKPTATEAEINDPNDYTRRTNPTLTDSKGYYEFRGVDVSKKYYIEYTYNGQTYTPTDYMDVSQLEKLQSDNSSHGTTEEWQQASKGTERETERTEFDLKFSSIGSYPNNYPSDNNLGINLPSDKGKQYNKTFTEYNLVGIELNSSGKYVYKNNNIQLVDTYLTIEDGIVIDTANPLSGRETEIKYGWISKTIRNYVKNLDINGNTISGTYQNLEHKYPTDEIMKDYIYKQIVDKLVSFGEDQQVTWEKLQFIEDCQISSYTKPIDAEDIKDFVNYPYGDYYTIAITKGPKYPNNSYKDGTYVDGASIGNEYPNIIMKHNGTLEGHDKMTVAYNNIYPGHLFINLGLLERNELDVALEKDVYKATLKINGKTHVYEYNERDVITPEEKAELARLHKEAGRNSLEYLQYQTALDSKYWEIQTRITDYETYYDDATYNRELYSSDINFNGTDNLEVYVTYKITIRNQSQMLLAQIDELVDYYDETYEPVLDKSWVMYKENSTDDNQAVYVFDQDFYDIMVEDRKVGDGEKYRSITSNGYNTQTGKYAQNTRYKLDGYQTLYVDGWKDNKLVSGESADVYLTFKVENEGKDLQKDLNKAKHNIIEINGYTSYYQDGIELPNGYNVKNGKLYRGSKQIRNIAYAGLIDHDSTPGNFREELMDKNGRYEHNFEDDTDRARAITIKLDREAQRIISGVAWEDKRDTKVDEALIGNGIRQNGEVTIEGIQVELLEVQLDEDGNASFDSNGDIRTKGIAKLYQANGSTVNAVTKTDRNGNYQFKGFIPGDYIVRFTYGEEFNAHYNGQDYKTTTYQIGIDQTNGRTDVAKPEDPGYEGYTDLGNYGDSGRNYGDNASGTYGYDIFEADYNSKGNVSDAKDLWRLRSAVNKDNSQNYSGVTNTYATDLNNNDTPNSVAITQMIADTGVIRAEFEYNRQHSKTNGLDNNDYGGTSTGENEYLGGNNGEANNKNATYHIKNVDLGLEERPKAQLEINKQVNNVKIVLANQNVLFDANKTATNLIWQSKIPYNINDEKEETKYDNKAQRVTAGSNEVYSDYTRYNDFRQYVIDTIDTRLRNSSGIIQATMDEELMHGATIQITYDITVENIGEVDYKETSFYYTGKIGNKNTEVRTSADVILDYVSNNLQFRTENNKNEWGWKTITTGDIQRLDYVDDDLERAKKLEEFNTIISTGSLKKALLPLTSKRESGSKDTSISTQLVLTQTITAENDNDDLTYGNLAEIVKISNDVGRRMAFSVQGNQDPTKPDSITEPDTSKAERVVILPPFGSEYVYYGLAALVMALLAIGIIIIKKVVLPKNK